MLVLRKEARLAIVAALHDVQRNTIEVNSAAPRHRVANASTYGSLAPSTPYVQLR